MPRFISLWWLIHGKGSDNERHPCSSRSQGGHIIRRLKNIVKLPVTKIAIAVGRNKSTVYSALDKKWKASKRGRPELLTKKQVTLLVRTTKAMIQKAAGKREVILAMITKRARVGAGAGQWYHSELT